MNKNPVWKYLVLVMLVAFGLIYALPNLYVADPGIQVIGVRNTEINEAVLGRVSRALEQNGLEVQTIGLENNTVRARFNSEADQTQARDLLKETLGSRYGVALACLLYTSPSPRDRG